MKYTKRQFKNKFKSSYWLNLYASIRSIESRTPLKQIRYRGKATEDKVLLAINNLYKPLITMPVSNNQVRVINDQLSNTPKFETVKQRIVGITEGPSRFVYGASDFIGSAYLSLTGGVLTYADGGAATFEGSGTLTADGGKFVYVGDSATFEGSGTLTADGGKFVYVSGEADILGTGSLVGIGETVIYESNDVSFDGAATMQAQGTQISTTTAIFTGTSEMSVDGVPISVAAVTFTGTSDMIVEGEAFTNIPTFVHYAWEIDFGVTTSSNGYVTLWEDQKQGLNFSGTDGHGYFDFNYSGTYIPALIFSRSTHTFDATFPDPSPISGGFSFLVVADIISGSDDSDASNNEFAILQLDEDVGYGSSQAWALDIGVNAPGINYRLWEAASGIETYDGRYYDHHRQDSFVDMLVNSAPSGTWSSETDLYVERELFINNKDLDNYYYPHRHEYTEIKLGLDAGRTDRSAYMAVKAVYAATSSLGSTERTELWDYLDSRWRSQYIVPEVLDITTTGSAAIGTLHDVPMPSTVNRSDLLVAVFAEDGGHDLTEPLGWYEVVSDEYGGADAGMSVYARYATGSEGGTTVQFSSSVSRDYGVAIARIASGTWHETSNLADAIQSTGMSSSNNSYVSDPPPISSSWMSHNLPLAATAGSALMNGFDTDAGWEGGVTSTPAASGTYVSLEYYPSGSARHITDTLGENFYGVNTSFQAASNHLAAMIAVKPHPRFSDWKELLDWHSNRGDFTGSSLIQLVKSDGSTVADVSGQSNEPTISGTLTFDSQPVTWGDKYPIESDASGGDYLHTTGILNLSSSTSWTFSCIAENSPSHPDVLFGLGDSDSNQIALYNNNAAGGTLYLRAKGGSTVFDTVAVPFGQIFGLTIRREVDDLDWWVDGVFQGTVDLSAQSFTSATDLYYLYGIVTSGLQWDGRFQHRGTFDDALSDELCVKFSTTSYP